jgi:hypothetical protein
LPILTELLILAMGLGLTSFVLKNCYGLQYIKFFLLVYLLVNKIKR